MGKPKIFVTQPIEESALKRLQKKMIVEMHRDSTKSITEEDMIKGVSGNNYLLCFLGNTVNADVINANKNLKFIVTVATAPENIDLEIATLHNIPVAGREVPIEGIHKDSIIEETADLTWGLLLAVSRRIIEGDRLVRTGIFPGPMSMYLLGMQVHGKTLGIVGMGKVGKAVARRAFGFKMKILYYSRSRCIETEDELGVIYCSIEELIKESDFITLLPKYTPETHHLFSYKELSRMKPTAILINTSRGPILDQAALIEALDSKKIAGAALDVFEGEPHPDLPKKFISMKNVIFTPHLGGQVAEKHEIMTNTAVDIILGFLGGRLPANIFNPEVFETLQLRKQ